MLSPLYGQLSPLRIPTSIPFDESALAYIAAVEAADGAALEDGVKSAINSFVVGCKSDGIWSAIKASCILAGARTLTGALVPLVGTAPTNYNFVSGDYNRETGLKGNATTKYLNSNRAENADPQNNNHITVNLTQHVGSANRYILGAATTSPTVVITGIGDNYIVRSRANNTRIVAANSTASFVGVSRSTSANFNSLILGSIATTTSTSLTPSSLNYYIFAANINGNTSNLTAHRLSFYSIGEALNLADLDSRVSTLMTDLAAAIP